MSNVAAALDKTALSGDEKAILWRYAEATRTGYCAGCADICGAAAGVPIADMMRCLMYARDYNDPAAASEAAAALDRRGAFDALDEGRILEAESRCPQGLPLRRLVAQAAALAQTLTV